MEQPHLRKRKEQLFTYFVDGLGKKHLSSKLYWVAKPGMDVVADVVSLLCHIIDLGMSCSTRSTLLGRIIGWNELIVYNVHGVFERTVPSL